MTSATFKNPYLPDLGGIVRFPDVDLGWIFKHRAYFISFRRTDNGEWEVVGEETGFLPGQKGPVQVIYRGYGRMWRRMIGEKRFACSPDFYNALNERISVITAQGH